MNDRAIVLIGRKNPEATGASPFSPFGTGVCIDSNGVIATCWHTFDSFHTVWTLVDFDEVWKSVGQTFHYTVEDHEKPYILFNTILKPPNLFVPIQPIGLCADREEDVAVVELGGQGKYRPLPFIGLSDRPSCVGMQVEFVGHHQPANRTPKDKYGMSLGWALTCQTANVVFEDEKFFYIDYQVEKGMSGGPVIDPSSGLILGVITEFWLAPRTNKLLGINCAVTKVAKANLLKSQLERLREDANKRAENGGSKWCSLKE